MKRRSFIKGLAVAPFIRLPLGGPVPDTLPIVEETIPLSDMHGPMVTGWCAKSSPLYDLPTKYRSSDEWYSNTS